MGEKSYSYESDDVFVLDLVITCYPVLPKVLLELIGWESFLTSKLLEVDLSININLKL